MGAYKNYNIQIKGKVQDIGFRNLVENIARSLNLRGMVYNDIDGTVKIVCQGGVSSVKSLVEEIRNKSINVGANIGDISQEEIMGTLFLPPIFFKAPTDELSDISRKLDVGIQSIQGIEDNTRQLIGNTDSLINGQEKIIKLLEKIAGK